MAGKYVKCKSCGKIFPFNGKNECPMCLMEVERKFDLIKNYLYNYPSATVLELSEKTGVEEATILHFLREGRLEMKSADGSLCCEKCGKPVTSGRMCKECAGSISNALNRVLPKKEVPVKEKPAPAGLGSSSERLHIKK